PEDDLPHLVAGLEKQLRSRLDLFIQEDLVLEHLSHRLRKRCAALARPLFDGAHNGIGEVDSDFGYVCNRHKDPFRTDDKIQVYSNPYFYHIIAISGPSVKTPSTPAELARHQLGPGSAAPSSRPGMTPNA